MSTYNHWFIRARLKARQLLLLVALAEEGNIHRAAQVLSMTQPAASKLLKDLEDVLEVSLFDRLPRGMRPTWYGETMIRHARMALANLNQAHDEIGALKRGHYGQVGIGAITSPGLSLLPAAVAQVKQEHPACAFRWTSKPARCCWSGWSRASSTSWWAACTRSTTRRICAMSR
jgi:transcriptional regulator, LysR family